MNIQSWEKEEPIVCLTVLMDDKRTALGISRYFTVKQNILEGHDSGNYPQN